MKQWLLAVTAVLAAGGVALDLASLVLWLRRNARGGGPSGVPGVSWFAYLSFCMARRWLAALAALTVFHALCQFVIPGVQRRLQAK